MCTQPSACSFHRRGEGWCWTSRNSVIQDVSCGRGRKAFATHGVADTPDGNTDALGSVEAGTNNCGVIGSRSTRNVELCDGDFLNISSSHGSQGCLSTVSLATLKVGLGTNSVDGVGGGLINTVDEGDQSVQLSVNRVEIVIVDVETIMVW